jgi:hypothetical protein
LCADDENREHRSENIIEIVWFISPDAILIIRVSPCAIGTITLKKNIEISMFSQ